MPTDLILIVQTALWRYAIQRDDVLEIKLVASAADLQDSAQGRSCIGVELGPLLDPADRSTLARRRALVVPLRQGLVALLADQVEVFQEHTRIEALPALLAARLRQPWAIGALQLGADLVVQLDLYAVAHTALTLENLRSGGVRGGEASPS